jgi:hypothetical protein
MNIGWVNINFFPWLYCDTYIFAYICDFSNIIELFMLSQVSSITTPTSKYLVPSYYLHPKASGLFFLESQKSKV